MRHSKHKNKLGLNKAHRLAVVRNLSTQLLQHEQITTTLAKAKNLRSQIDKIITLAKKQDLASRKRIISFLKNKIAVQKLYEDYLKIYQDRVSGYTRIYRLKNRLGDNATMVLISMVDREKIVKKEDKADSSTLKQVKEDIEKNKEGETKTDEPSVEVVAEKDIKTLPKSSSPEKTKEEKSTEQKKTEAPAKKKS
jgi:large subunit ribosomal protein L17